MRKVLVLKFAALMGTFAPEARAGDATTDTTSVDQALTTGNFTSFSTDAPHNRFSHIIIPVILVFCVLLVLVVICCVKCRQSSSKRHSRSPAPREGVNSSSADVELELFPLDNGHAATTALTNAVQNGRTGAPPTYEEACSLTDGVSMVMDSQHEEEQI